ncbi:MAG: N-6 DNA methylase [Novosphingobium sp.]
MFKKCREHGENVLFIDASGEFDKVKNQNVLRPEHIDRIVATYRQRTETDKFSHIAPLSEIAENDYNLNIPRYVDTFEEEGRVDLDAVLAELKAIDGEMAGVDATIAGFCQELGLEAPL